MKNQLRNQRPKEDILLNKLKNKDKVIINNKNGKIKYLKIMTSYLIR